MDLTIPDLPALRDALDTVAELDLDPAATAYDASRASRLAYSDAAAALRDARSRVMDAIDALRRAGVEFADDDDD